MRWPTGSLGSAAVGLFLVGHLGCASRDGSDAADDTTGDAATTGPAPPDLGTEGDTGDYDFLVEHCGAANDLQDCRLKNQDSPDFGWRCIDPVSGREVRCLCAWKESLKVDGNAANCEGTTVEARCFPALRDDLRPCPWFQLGIGGRCDSVTIGEASGWLTMTWGTCFPTASPEGDETQGCFSAGPDAPCSDCTKKLVAEVCGI